MIDPAAHAFGIGRVMHSVENDLGHGAASFDRFNRRFVVEGLCQAL